MTTLRDTNNTEYIVICLKLQSDQKLSQMLGVTLFMPCYQERGIDAMRNIGYF